MRRRIFAQCRFNDFLERFDVFAARLVREEAFVFGQRRQTDGPDQGCKKLVVAGGHDQVTIGAAVRLERRDRRVARAQRSGHAAGGFVARDGVLQNRDLAVEH